MNYTRPEGVLGGPCLNCHAGQPEHVGKSCEEVKATRQEAMSRRMANIRGRMEKTLLPCPFCCGTPSIQMIPAHDHAVASFMPRVGDTWTLECGGCEAGFCGGSREEVEAQWNRRDREDSLRRHISDLERRAGINITKSSSANGSSPHSEGK